MKYRQLFLVSCVCFAYYINAFGSLAQSSIITLNFPFGARSTGMGETFVGIANGVDATFYNPAGLGQTPLANSWRSYTPITQGTLTTLASKMNRSFQGTERVWFGTSNQGLLLYNGKAWLSYELYLIEEGDNLGIIVNKFLSIDDKQLQSNAKQTIREANKIEQKRYTKILNLLKPALKDTFQKNDPLEMCKSLANTILDLDTANRTAVSVYGLISNSVDSTKASSISDSIAFVLKNSSDILFSDLIEIRIPFNIAISDSITSLAVDESEQLWIGTLHGLYKYNAKTWNRYTTSDGLPSDSITTISIGSLNRICVVTTQGLGIYSHGTWNLLSLPEEHDFNTNITSAALSKDTNLIYVGTHKGLVQISKDTAVIFDTTSGVLSNEITALYVDSHDKVWVGSQDGISIFNGSSWKRYRFPGSTVHCFAEDRPGHLWIGTNKGAITYEAAPANKKDAQGKPLPPQWNHFHSKNVLHGDNVYAIAVQTNDVWLLTEKGINQYDKGLTQATVFFEPLLPKLGISELWHFSMAGCKPSQEWGTIGLFINYLNFGKNDITNAQGKVKKTVNSYEMVVAACYGLPLKEDLSVGLNLKYAYSALAPGIEEDRGWAQTFAVDAALLKRNFLINNLSIGMIMQNMGPPVSYISKENEDPIPFCIKGGLAYNPIHTPVHDLTIACDLERELVFKKDAYSKPDPFWLAIYHDLYRHDGWKKEYDEVVKHVGIEYWYVYFIGLRMGYMHDWAGSRREVNFGLGLRYGTMIVDWSYIFSPETSVVRDEQWRFSFTFSK